MNSASLRTRFIAACLLLVTISTAGYAIAVAQFVELLEAQLVDQRLGGELEEFADAYRADPRVRGPQAAGLTSFALPPGADDGGLPEPLRRLKAGARREMHLDGTAVAAGRVDVEGARLYAVLDMSEVEDFERRFVVLAWLSAIISWIAAIVLATALARRVLRPVAQLAERVGALQPDAPHAPLAAAFDDREIRSIATAFDRFADRMQAFVSRERAFTEDASHELRTPLAIIDSSVQLLADDERLDAASRQRVQRIGRAVQQMQVLIEALLFLAREQGSVPAEEFALDALAAELVDAHRELLGQRPLRLELQAVSSRAHAPRAMVSCVLSNLLQNAMHYTEQGHVRVEVRPGCLVVEDTGIGIPPEDLARIFERRFRGAQSRGLGLGLYLVKRICDRIGWSVKLNSTPGSGTRFELRFPAA